MAKRPRKQGQLASSGQPDGTEAGALERSAGRARTTSDAANEAIRRLARLVGRQIAREQAKLQTEVQRQPSRRELALNILRKG